MAWSNQFIEALKSGSKHTQFILRFLGSSLDYQGFADTYGGSGEIAIEKQDISIDLPRITPVRWSVNFGGFSIRVKGDLRSKGFWRGQLVALYCVKNKARARIAMGQLYDIEGRHGVYTLVFRDILSAMLARASVKATETQFFSDAGKSTLTNQSFNYGASPNDRLYVDNLDIFDKCDSVDGMISVEDTQHGYDDLRWTWSSKTYTSGSAGYLTISSVGVFPSLISHGHVPSGAKITSVARLFNRIDYIFAQMLMSTGAGTQGFFDTYPKNWGFGYKFSPFLINKTDMDEFYKHWRISAPNNHYCQLPILEPTNIRSIVNYSLQMGLFPVFRQGRFTFRGALDPNTANGSRVVAHITDSEIFEVQKHNFYSPDQTAYYGQSTLKYYESSTQTFTSHISVIANSEQRYSPSAPEIIRDNSYIYSALNQQEKAEADNARLKNWDQYPYEQLTLVVSEEFAQHTAGDLVEITSKKLYGRNERTSQTFNRRRAMILGIRWLPVGNRCILTLGILSRN